MRDGSMGSDDAPPAQPLQLLQGRFSGRLAFSQAVRDALSVAARDGWPEIILADASFEDWPLHERVVDESLHAWARSGRRFVMVARRYDAVARMHARFVAWRRTWDHLVECRSCRHIDATDFPSALAGPSWVLQRLDLVRSTGVCGSAPEQRVRIRETLDELLRASSPAFPSTTLGL